MTKLSVAFWSRSELVRMGFAALIVCGTVSAFAADAGAVSSRVRNACKSDYRKYCPQYEPGTPQARSCMSQAGKRRSLTPRCLNALVDAGHVPKKYLDKR